MSSTSFQCLTNHGVGISSERANELRSDRDFELAKGPLGVEIVGQELETLGEAVGVVRVITSH